MTRLAFVFSWVRTAAKTLPSVDRTDDWAAFWSPWGVTWETCTSADNLVTADDSAVEPVAVATPAAVAEDVALPDADTDMSKLCSTTTLALFRRRWLRACVGTSFSSRRRRRALNATEHETAPGQTTAILASLRLNIVAGSVRTTLRLKCETVMAIV